MSSTKFIKNKEDFICVHCGAKVKGTGYTNHCPNCLWSRHVDNNPGDRKALCQAMMEPIGLIIKKDWVIIHKCQKCGKIIKNKAADNDNRQELITLSKKIIPNIS